MNAKIWGRWLARLFKQAPKRIRRRLKPQSRLSVEYLEDRLTPTTYTWTGLGGSSNWNVAANWSSSAGGSAAPSTAPGAVDDLVFGALTPGATKPTNNNFTGLIVNSITFSGNPVAGSGYTLSGNSIVLVGGINVGANLGLESITLSMTLTPPTSTLQQTFTIPSASTLDISGILTEQEPATGGNSAATETAEETLTKAGAGILQLDGNNSTYTGAITIAPTGGILVITNSNALGLGKSVAGVSTAGTTTISSGTQLQVETTATNPLNVPEQLIINGTGIINDGALLNTLGNSTWSGLITMDSNSTFGANSGTTLSIAGQITDVGSGDSLTKTGPGTIVFSRVGGNTYRGQTIINNGILEIEDPLSLGAGANSTTTQSGTPQAETIVNYDPTTGIAGTLELNFTGTLGANDPNGILEDPYAAYNATTNPYIGFQVFNDDLVLNGPGFTGLGALFNLNGDNAWDGNVALGSPSNVPNTGNVTIGVATPSATAPNTNLTISGVVSSVSPLPTPLANLIKNNGGTLILNDDNTFTGNVYIENGAINIGDSNALGSFTTNKVFVGYFPDGITTTGLPAALQLQVDSGLDGTMANGVLEKTHYRNLGFDSVNGSGPGQELDVPGTSGTFTLSITTYTSTGLGITYNSSPVNVASATFTTDLTNAVVSLLNQAGFPATGNVSVSEVIAGSGIGNLYRLNFTGALANSDIPLMTVSQSTLVLNPNGPAAGQEKIGLTGTSGAFTLSLTKAGTTYTTTPVSVGSPTIVADLTSAVTAMINSAGYTATGNVTVTETTSGSTNILTIAFSGALQGTPLPSMTPALSNLAVNAIYGLTVANPLTLTGNGVGTNPDGALDSISGLNTYTGPIRLNPTLATGVASIGVDADTRAGHNLADSNYLADDYSLTIKGNGIGSGIISGGSGTTLNKFGLGDLILPTANNYVSPNDIEAGWVTVENNQSLGVQQNLTQTLQSYTTVAAGAALMLDPQSSFLALANNFALSGNGLTPSATVPNVFGLIDQSGAIENLNGNNFLTGIIQLNGNAGIGVEQVFSPPPNTTPTSQLTISGTLENGSTAGGITKLGSRRLIIEGPGTYTGNVNVDDGVLLVQNSTALGEGNVNSPPTVTVEPGAALEIGNTVTAAEITNSLGGATYTSSENGGIQEGLEIWGENLILNGAGDPTFGDTALTILSSNAPTTGPEVQTVAVSPSGSFTLTYGGQTTTALSTSSSAAEVETALDDLTSISDFTGAYATVTQSGNVFLITIVNPTDPGLAVTAAPVVPSGTANPADIVVSTTQTGSTSETLAPVNDPLVSTDNIWEGPVSINTNVTITVPTDSRLILAGNIGNGTNIPTNGYGGSGITVTGGGEVDLDGTNTYSGTTFVDQGVLTVGNSSGLGTTGVPEVQTLKLMGATAGTTQFVLTFTNLANVVDMTSAITYSGNAATDEANIAAALNSLANIGGAGSDAGGVVSVTELISATAVTISVTFAGTLSGFPQNLLSAEVLPPPPASPPVPTATITVEPLTPATTGGGGTVVANGASLQLSGSVTIAGEPLIIQGNGSLQDTQTLTITATSGSFNLSYTGANATGNVVTDITATPLDVTSGTLAQDIKNALMNLGNIGGVGGTVTVTQSGDTFTIVFGGTLSGLPLQTMSVSVVSPLVGGTVSVLTTQVGDSAAQNIPSQWFQVGPTTISGGQTAGNSAVAGSVTAIAVDPDDPNTIYIATAGGGVWKTINGGQNWYPIFDSIPEIQTITVNTTGSFTLSFNGDTTTSLAGNDPNLALDMQAALDALGSVGGAGGLVTIFQSSANTYQVTFGGSLAGLNVPLITSSAPPSGTVTIGQLENGTNPSFAMYVGAIAINPNNPNVIYVGTGVADNSGDSFYGTGIYETTNAGVTWSLMTNNTAINPTAITNPFYGKVVSAMVVDPENNDLIVSDGDSTQGQNEVQTLSFGGDPNPFTITLTAPDATGASVTDTTAALTYDPADPAFTAQEIQDAMNAFSNIGGVGGFVVVTPLNPAIYTITFEGNLSLTTLPAVVVDWPLPNSPPPPVVGVKVSAVAGPTTDVNGTTGAAGSAPGIWRFTPSSGFSASGVWENLTSVTSTTRATQVSANDNDPIYGPNGTLAGITPDSPGPDDDYQIFFPQSNATWTDVQLVESTTGQFILFAALGSSSIGTTNTMTGTPADGVFWSTSFAGSQSNVSWNQGNPWTGSVSSANAVFTPDNEDKTMFPSPFYVDDNSGKGPENGDIKISAVTGGTWSDEPGPLEDYFGVGSNDGFVTIYASVSTAGGNLQNIYESTDGGVDWAAVASLPTTYMTGEGQYDNSILAVNDTTVYVGGQVGSGNIAGQTGQIFMTSNSGGAWTDLSVLNNSGPHDSQHAIVQDDGNGVLFGNDGGIWLLNSTNSAWTDVNGNLANSEVNSVASDPTNITGIATSPATVTTVAGIQGNGTAGFSEGQVWSELDDSEGGEMSGNQVFIDPTNPNIIYEVQTQIGSGMGAVVRESGDDGATWNTILQYPTITSADVALAMDQINPDRLVVGGGVLTLQQLDAGVQSGLYETIDATDGTPVWTNIAVNNNTGQPTLPITVSAIGLAEYQGTFVTDPSFPDVTDQGANAYVPNTIYVTNGTKVYLTKDGGLTWVERDTGLAAGGDITQLVVDPRNENVVYAVTNGFGDGGVWVSTNAGMTWTQIGTNNGLPNVPVWSLVIDPRNNNLYVGTDTGVYTLVNGGLTESGTWQVFGTGMPNVQVHDLVLNQTTNTLLAATYGRGVFELFLDNAETASAPISTSAATGLSGPSVWSGDVILSGNISLGADGAQNLPNGISTGSINFVGQISDMVVGSNPTIDKVGGGNVIFSGSNTYGGLTDVQQGNLVVDNSQALGADSTGTADGTIVEDGAALELESNLGAETVTLDGDGSSFNGHYTGALRNIAGDNTFTGNVDYGTNDPNSTVTIGADSGSELTMTGTISGSNTIALIKEGTGTIALAGDNTYTGSTYVYQGALQAESDNALGAGSSATNASVTVLDGAQLQLQTPTGGSAVTISGLPLFLSGTGIFGTGALLDTGGNNTWAGTITLALLPGFSPNTLPSGDVAIGANAGDTLTINAPVGELQVSGQFGNGGGFQTVGQESGVNKVGSGTVVLEDADTFTGGVTVSQGILVAGNSNSVGSHPTVDPTLGTVQQIVTLSSEQVGSFQLSFDGATTTMAYNITAAAMQSKLNSPGGLFAGAGTVTVLATPIETTDENTPTSETQSGILYTLTFGGGLADTAVALKATGTNGTVAGASFVTQGGDDVLVDTGAEFDLNNSNTPSTPIDVVGHTISLNGSGVSGNGALQNTAGDNTWNGPIIEQTGPSSSGTSNPNPTLNSNIGATSGTSLTLAGPITVDLFNSVPLPLTLGGSGNGGGGTLIFPAGTSFTGQTIITGGNVQVDGTLGVINLAGGAVSGTGNVGHISDVGTSGGIVNPGDNGDSTLVNGKLTFPSESAVPNTNVAGTLTTTGVNLSSVDTYDAYFGDPATPNDSSLLQVNGAIAINGATLSGYIDPNVQVGSSITIIKTNYDGGLNPSDTVTGTFVDQNANGSTPTDPGALATTTAYIDNEKFLVDYYIDHVTITRVSETVTMSALTVTVPPGAPASPVYGEDVQVNVFLTPESNVVNLSGSTVVFQITTPQGTSLQFDETVEATSPPPSSPPGTATYEATIDLPESLEAPLAVTTGTGYSVSVYYSGQVSDGAQLFSAVSDGTVSGLPATEVNPAATVTVAPANTTTTLSVSPSASKEAYGTNLTFTATVTSALPVADQPPAAGLSQPVQPPQGSVAFYDTQNGNQVLLGFGTLTTTGGVTTATFSTSTLAVGNHSITAVYEANGIPDNYNTSNSDAAPISLLITQVASTLTLTASPTTSTYDGAIQFVATVNPPVGNQGIPTGTVTFQYGNTVLGTAQLFTVGNVTSATFTTNPAAQFQIPASATPQTITASYAGDGNFGPSTGMTQVTVNQSPTTTTVKSSANPSSAGQAVTFTATVFPPASVVGGASPTGTVVFQITNGSTTITGSGTVSTVFGVTTATFTTSQMPAGNNTVTVTYSGDSNFAGSTGTLSGGQVVSAGSTTTAITATPAPPAVGVAAQAFTISATVTATGGGFAFGTVNFTDSTTGKSLGSATLNGNGVATIQAPLGTPYGTHVILATFVGNASFTPSAANTTVIVSPNGTRASKVTLTSSQNPSTLGSAVTLTATVKDAGAGAAQTPTGTVTFRDVTTGTILGFGTLTTTGGVTTATLTTSSFVAGDNVLAAVYTGSTLFASVASAEITQVVLGVMPSSVTVTSSSNPSSYGQAVAFTATVQDTGTGTQVTPTGTVTFVITNTTTGATVYSVAAALKASSLGVSTATLATTSLTGPLPAGTYTVAAIYNGDSNFMAGSNGSLTQVVNQDTSTTTLTGTANAVYGQAETYVATVTSQLAAAVPTGTVSFYANGSLLGTVAVVTKAGKTTATYTTRGLIPNSYSIQAVYNGSANVQTSTSGTVSLTVNQAASNVGLALSTTASYTPLTIGATVVAVAPGSGIPTGTITFYVDGLLEGTVSLNSAGKAAVSLPGGLTPGDHTIEAVYSGDVDFLSFTRTATVDFVQGRGT